MKKQYSAPIVEKIVFDYKVQTSSATSQCFYSVMNLINGTDTTSYTQCDGVWSTPTYFGWTLPNPGV